jgi:NAD(P)-dependent dehydrogenase (short-subunit alcohol dehydrogenase family)
VLIKDITAAVSGGASGLGAATARALARLGARVYGLDLPTAIDKADRRSDVDYVEADVTNPHSVKAALNRASSDNERS